MEKNRVIWSIVLNGIAVLLVIFSIFCCFVEVFPSEEGLKRAECFRFFTMDSNIFAAISCLIMLIFGAKILSNPEYELPQWAVLLKFIGTIAVLITFIVTLIYLTPAVGVAKLYTGPNFFLHLVVPLICLFTCLFFDSSRTISSKASFLGVIPMAIYSVVYLVMVVVVGEGRGGWEDFYGFNRSGLFVVSIVVMYTFTFSLCYLFNFLRNKLIAKKESAK